MVLVGEEECQLAGQAGVLLQEGAAVRLATGLLCLEIIGDDLMESPVSIVGILAAPVG